MICKVQVNGYTYFVVGDLVLVKGILESYAIEYEGIQQTFVPDTSVKLYDIGRLVNTIINK